MCGLFRSEEMTLCQIFVPNEAAYFVVSKLGEKEIVQFMDLNQSVNAFQRTYVNDVRRCAEMERKLRYILKHIKKCNIAVPQLIDLPEAPIPRELSTIEDHLSVVENDLRKLNKNAVKLKSKYLELVQLKQVIGKVQDFFTDVIFTDYLASRLKTFYQEECYNIEGSGGLSLIAGVINRDKMASFERVLFRICRGNVVTKQIAIDDHIEDPETEVELKKVVFLTFFHGEQLKTIVEKVCKGFRATIYDCPNTYKARRTVLEDLNGGITDVEMVLNQTQEHRYSVLLEVANEYQKWNAMVKKMKAIYHVLNSFSVDVTKKCLIGECWVPKSNVAIVQDTLLKGSMSHGVFLPSFMYVVRTKVVPPTYHRTNKFTVGFQKLIDAYGIACYREANPAMYTIITFPFLFAIMFGDFGHALILIIFATVLIVKEQKIILAKVDNEIFSIFFAGRYIILLMGLFSLYTGFIYNDIFSKSMNLFGTSWSKNLDRNKLVLDNVTMLNPEVHYGGHPYAMGFDPIWNLSHNKIIFLNSVKMKLSIILGVVHMILGVVISTVNYVYFKKYSSIIFDFIPQLIILCSLFLWLAVMVWIKWLLYSPNNKDQRYGIFCAPSLLVYFIDMMMMKESVSHHKNCPAYMFDQHATLQKALFYAFICCIPVMLFAKPLISLVTRRRRFLAKLASLSEGMNKSLLCPEEIKEEPVCDVFTIQAIHAVEYVLSTVSHTASYLRLWALSLAHAQLSDVLWSRLLKMGLTTRGYLGLVKIFFIFWAWQFFTVAVLVVMEGLSAFLHTLRLHWVEFMSKFYSGTGYPFVPFSLRTVLDEDAIFEEEKLK